MAVLAHINQPLGSCMPYIAKLATASVQPPFNDPAMEYQMASATENEEDCGMGPSSWPDEQDASQHKSAIGDRPVTAVDSLPNPQHGPDNTSVADEFQGAGWTFGKGKTFLEDFTTDPYAAERKVNLYYPFASKEEWELALFLLLSGLSMANITKFLLLRLVCSFSLLQSCTQIHRGMLRSRHFASCFEPQRTCAHRQKCFQKAHNGSLTLGKLQNQLRNP